MVDTLQSILSSLSYTAIPDTFQTILVSSLLFIAFVLLVSVITAKREQNYYTTAFFLRTSIFLMNIVPIAVFQHALFPKMGFMLIYFFLVYLLLQYIFDIIRSFVVMPDGSISSKIFRITAEIFMLFVSGVVVYLIVPQGYKSVNMRNIDIAKFSEYSVYILYIVLFNSVTFFTAEYGIAAVSAEYKKNHSKYYCRYNDGLFVRFVYLLRNSAPQILGKIRKNISWLVSFIITVETVFELINSIGFNLLDGYREDSVIIIKNIFYLLCIMFIINTVIDILLVLFHKEKENEPIDNPGKNTDIKIDWKAVFKGKRKLLIAVCVILYAGLGVFNYFEYPFAGYYDFEANKTKTVDNFLDKQSKDIKSNTRNVFDAGLLNLPLCKKVGNAYDIVQLEIQDAQGKKTVIIPFYDKAGQTYYFIQDSVNKQKIKVLANSNTITNISVVKKFHAFSWTSAETAFRLPADTSKSTFGVKPLYLIIPFYLFYFLTLLLIVGTVTFIIYYSIIKRHILKIDGKKTGKAGIIAKRMTTELLQYLNTLSLVVVFMLANLFIQNTFNSQWENKSFLLNIFSFSIIQLVIICMFSDTYLQEIKLHVKNIFESQEFKYYRLIGIDRSEQSRIYNKKYGSLLFWKLYVQNILFVVNINWFMSYAFNVWRNFKDAVGLTYAINFENIFTKIVHLDTIRTAWFNYGILFALYSSLFAAYYFLQKKLNKER
jgi:hypothetical protein